MDIHTPQKMYEVTFDARIPDIYVVADSEAEVLQIIGERYDSDRFSFDWRAHEIVGTTEKSIERAVKGRHPPFQAFWLTEDGVHGIEKQANQGGSKGLYWIQ